MTTPTLIIEHATSPRIRSGFDLDIPSERLRWLRSQLTDDVDVISRGTLTEMVEGLETRLAGGNPERRSGHSPATSRSAITEIPFNASQDFIMDFLAQTLVRLERAYFSGKLPDNLRVGISDVNTRTCMACYYKTDDGTPHIDFKPSIVDGTSRFCHSFGARGRARELEDTLLHELLHAQLHHFVDKNPGQEDIRKDSRDHVRTYAGSAHCITERFPPGHRRRSWAKRIRQSCDQWPFNVRPKDYYR
jgi:hypothetical protein